MASLLTVDHPKSDHARWMNQGDSMPPVAILAAEGGTLKDAAAVVAAIGEGGTSLDELLTARVIVLVKMLLTHLMVKAEPIQVMSDKDEGTHQLSTSATMADWVRHFVAVCKAVPKKAGAVSCDNRAAAFTFGDEAYMKDLIKSKHHMATFSRLHNLPEVLGAFHFELNTVDYQAKLVYDQLCSTLKADKKARADRPQELPATSDGTPRALSRSLTCFSRPVRFALPCCCPSFAANVINILAWCTSHNFCGSRLPLWQ